MFLHIGKKLYLRFPHSLFLFINIKNCYIYINYRVICLCRSICSLIFSCERRGIRRQNISIKSFILFFFVLQAIKEILNHNSGSKGDYFWSSFILNTLSWNRIALREWKTIDRIGKAKHITKLDLLKGYWTVPLTERAKEISAFVTPEGDYQYCVMPFGMRISQYKQVFGRHSWSPCIYRRCSYI